MKQTKDQRIVRFFSSLSLPADTSDEEDMQIEKLGDEFGEYIWSTEGIAPKLQALKSGDYGQSLKFILFQFLIFPEDEKLAELEEIEDFEPNEKNIAINCIVDTENFFDRTELERKDFLHDTILAKLGLLNEVIKRRKLDTKLEKLIADVQKLLS